MKNDSVEVTQADRQLFELLRGHTPDGRDLGDLKEIARHRLSTRDDVKVTDALRELIGDRPGDRSVFATLRDLRERFATAKCDNEAVSCCIRCQVMHLVSRVERARALLSPQPEQGPTLLDELTAETERLGLYPEQSAPVVTLSGPHFYDGVRTRFPNGLDHISKSRQSAPAGEGEVERAREYVASSMHDRDKSWGDLVRAGERDDCPEMRMVLKAMRTEALRTQSQPILTDEVVERAAKAVIKADADAVEAEIEPTSMVWAKAIGRAALASMGEG